MKGGYDYVVFDDRGEIARISDDLRSSRKNGLFGVSRTVWGYEVITYNADKRQYYLLVEARKHAKRCYRALIVE